MITPLLFTTAPEIYDLPGTTPAGHAGFDASGAVLRAVRVEVHGAIRQVERYIAAGYQACGEVGLDQIRAAGGIIEWKEPQSLTEYRDRRRSEARVR